jgi:hypothetical protein
MENKTDENELDLELDSFDIEDDELLDSSLETEAETEEFDIDDEIDVSDNQDSGLDIDEFDEPELVQSTTEEVDLEPEPKTETEAPVQDKEKPKPSKKRAVKKKTDKASASPSSKPKSVNNGDATPFYKNPLKMGSAIMGGLLTVSLAWFSVDSLLSSGNGSVNLSASQANSVQAPPRIETSSVEPITNNYSQTQGSPVFGGDVVMNDGAGDVSSDSYVPGGDEFGFDSLSESNDVLNEQSQNQAQAFNYDELLNDNKAMAMQIESLISENASLKKENNALNKKVASSPSSAELKKLKKDGHLYRVEIDSLKKRLKVAEKKLASRANPNSVSQQSARNMKASIPGWEVKGIVSGKALLTNSQGQTAMAQKGDVFAGVKILDINVKALSVTTDSGVITLK